jgi:sRNA-binding carbon storage regulator CsrA
VDPAKYGVEAAVSISVVRKGIRQEIKPQTSTLQLLYTYNTSREVGYALN